MVISFDNFFYFFNFQFQSMIIFNLSNFSFWRLLKNCVFARDDHMNHLSFLLALIVHEKSHGKSHVIACNPKLTIWHLCVNCHSLYYLHILIGHRFLIFIKGNLYYYYYFILKSCPSIVLTYCSSYPSNSENVLLRSRTTKIQQQWIV